MGNLYTGMTAGRQDRDRRAALIDQQALNSERAFKARQQAAIDGHMARVGAEAQQAAQAKQQKSLMDAAAAEKLKSDTIAEEDRRLGLADRDFNQKRLAEKDALDQAEKGAKLKADADKQTKTDLAMKKYSAAQGLRAVIDDTVSWDQFHKDHPEMSGRAKFEDGPEEGTYLITEPGKKPMKVSADILQKYADRMEEESAMELDPEHSIVSQYREKLAVKNAEAKAKADEAKIAAQSERDAAKALEAQKLKNQVTPFQALTAKKNLLDPAQAELLKLKTKAEDGWGWSKRTPDDDQQAAIDKAQENVNYIQGLIKAGSFNELENGGDPGQGNPKQITKEIALGFYNEAGGDKEKARKLAAKAGYTI